MAPKLPNIQLNVRKINPEGAKEYLKLLRIEYEAVYPNGEVSEPFFHDIVVRENKYDAVVIIPYFVKNDNLFIYLRSCLRPSLANRFVEGGNIWELAAGIIESNESPEEAASRELEEEVGFKLPPEAFKKLGMQSLTAVGTIAEQLFFFSVKVDPNIKTAPTEDGSPLERHAAVIPICLSQLNCMISRGELPDIKTELGIRRIEKLWHVGSV